MPLRSILDTLDYMFHTPPMSFLDAFTRCLLDLLASRCRMREAFIICFASADKVFALQYRKQKVTIATYSQYLASYSYFFKAITKSHDGQSVEIYIYFYDDTFTAIVISPDDITASSLDAFHSL